jgi:hypothetical protein
MIFSFWAGFYAQVIYAQRYLDKERSPAKYRAFFLPWAWEKSNQFGTYRLLKRIRKASVHNHWSWHGVNILEYLVGNSIVLTVPFVLWPHFVQLLRMCFPSMGQVWPFDLAQESTVSICHNIPLRYWFPALQLGGAAAFMPIIRFFSMFWIVLVALVSELSINYPMTFW